MEANGEENVILPESVWDELFEDLGIEFPPPRQEVEGEAINVNEERSEETDSADEVVVENVSANDPAQLVVGHKAKSATEEAEDTDEGDEEVFETGSNNPIATIVSRQKLRALRTVTKLISEEAEDTESADEVIEVASTSRLKSATEWEDKRKTRSSRHKTETNCVGRQNARTSRHKTGTEGAAFVSGYKTKTMAGYTNSGNEKVKEPVSKTARSVNADKQKTRIVNEEAENTEIRDEVVKPSSKNARSTSRHKTDSENKQKTRTGKSKAVTDCEGRRKTRASRRKEVTDSEGRQKEVTDCDGRQKTRTGEPKTVIGCKGRQKTMSKLKIEKAENADSGDKAIEPASKNVFVASKSSHNAVTDSKHGQKIWTVTKVKTGEAEDMKRGNKKIEPSLKNVCVSSTNRPKTVSKDTTEDAEVPMNVNESFEVDSSTNRAVVSVRVLSYEERKELKKIRERFIDNLYEAVKQIKEELKLSDPEFVFEEEEEEDNDDYVGPGECYFSRAHRYTIWKYIRSQKGNFDNRLYNYSRIITGGHLFEICKKQFIKTFKPGDYSEIGFVNFCAAMAYLGIHCTDYNLDCNAEIKAKGFIRYLLSGVLSRGALYDSSW